MDRGARRATGKKRWRGRGDDQGGHDQGFGSHCRGSDEVNSSGETISTAPRNPFRDSCDKAAIERRTQLERKLDRSDHSEFRFVVTYSDNELRTYQKMMASRYARAKSEGTAFGLLLAAILAVGLAVLAAFRLGLIEPSSIRAVLIAAYFAFTAGVAGYYFVMLNYFRKFLRTDQRGGTWNYSFTDAGIVYRSETIEVRLAWRAVDAVEDLGRLVALRFGAQGVIIPSRMFADDAARAAFVAAARTRIKAAAEKA